MSPKIIETPMFFPWNLRVLTFRTLIPLPKCSVWDVLFSFVLPTCSVWEVFFHLFCQHNMLSLRGVFCFLFLKHIFSGTYVWLFIAFPGDTHTTWKLSMRPPNRLDVLGTWSRFGAFSAFQLIDTTRQLINSSIQLINSSTHGPSALSHPARRTARCAIK